MQLPQPHANFTDYFDDGKTLDLIFLMDVTGSMGSYIDSAKANVERIASSIVQSEKIFAEDLRLGLIAYRDHPPQDKSFVYRQYPFTSNVTEIKNHLSVIRASGGGDGPEAVTAALNAALNLDWRPNAAKIIVLIADAPPHGLGESGDGFPNGDPDGLDPIIVSRAIAQKGIVIYPVACEPTLSTSYTYATDFFRSLAEITGGLMVPLTSANLLTQVIVGGAQEQLDLEKLIKEHGQEAANKVASGRSEQDVTNELHLKLQRRGQRTTQLVVDNVYEESDVAAYNVRVLSSAATLGEAKERVKRVVKPRLKSAFSSAPHWGPPPATRSLGGSRLPSSYASDEESDEDDDMDLGFEGFTLGDSSPMKQNVEVSRGKVSVDQVKRMVKQSVSRSSNCSRDP